MDEIKIQSNQSHPNVKTPTKNQLRMVMHIKKKYL